MPAVHGCKEQAKRWLVCALFSVPLLAGCTTERIVYQPVLPPDALLKPAEMPLKPNPNTATQRDVAIYLIELNSTLDRCINQQKILQQWKAKWTIWTEQNN